MHRLVVLAFPGISPFHLAVPCVLFGERFGDVLPARYELTVAATGAPGRLPTSAGFDIVVEHGLETLYDADTIVVPSADLRVPPQPKLLEMLQAAHGRGARVIGLCLGAFTVAAAGLVDDREAVTHWRFTDELAAQFPAVRTRSDVLWVDHDDVVTSAGVAASLDCCLHVVGKDHGVELATNLARDLVMAPNRGGDEAQWYTRPLRHDDGDPIERAMVWARAHLDEPIDVDRWSEAVSVSRRTFTRRFRERTGRTCKEWLAAQRVDHACRLLEKTDQTVDRIAAASGFGTSQVLRLHFDRELGTTPNAYRRGFRTNTGSDR